MTECGVKLGNDQVKKLGMKGVGLIVRRVGEKCSVSYRTPVPHEAKAELETLLNGTAKGAGLNVEWKRAGRRYQEFYVSLEADKAEIVKRGLPGYGKPNNATLERKGIKMFYGQRLGMPVGVKGTMVMDLVMYRTLDTATMTRVKLEIKAPTGGGKKIFISKAARNRMVGLLRHYLGAVMVQSMPKPRIWNGTLFEDRYKFGPVQKAIRGILAAEPEMEMPFDKLYEMMKCA